MDPRLPRVRNAVYPDAVDAGAASDHAPGSAPGNTCARRAHDGRLRSDPAADIAPALGARCALVRRIGRVDVTHERRRMAKR